MAYFPGLDTSVSGSIDASGYGAKKTPTNISAPTNTSPAGGMIGSMLGGAPQQSTQDASLFSAINQGNAAGTQEFINDPQMQALAAKRADLANGLNSTQMQAERGQAINQIQGQRQQYLRQLSGQAGKAGIGGARSIAMQASADKGFNQNAEQAERQLTMDNFNAVRQGTGDYQDFLMRQKLGKLGTGIAYGQLQAGQNASAAAAAAANQEPDKGFLGNLFSGIW